MLKAPSGFIEGVEKRLIKLAMSAKDIVGEGSVVDAVGLDIEKGGKVEGRGE